MLLEQERSELEAMGVHCPSGAVLRTARWTTHLSGSDHLVDILAREHFVSRVHLIPADDTPFNGRLAAQLCRGLAKRSVQVARAAAAKWEAYADELTAAMPTFADGYSDRWERMVNATVPANDRQVIAASLDPMRRVSWSLRLQRYGTDLLHAVGSPSYLPDVQVKGKPINVTKPDRVAFRGTKRFTLPKPCRYGANGPQPYREQRDRLTFAVDSLGIAEVSSQPLVELLTTLRPVDKRSRVRHGWRGHRRITWKLRGKQTVKDSNAARTAQRAAAAAERPAGQGARGPAATPWAMSSRSVPRAAERVDSLWRTLEAVMGRAAAGTAFTFSDGTRVTLVTASRITDSTRGDYPLREWSRRAALAGLTIA